MKKLIALSLVVLMAVSSFTACAVQPKVSATASAETDYTAYLLENVKEKPDTLVVGDADTALEHGIDMSDFEDEGFFTRAADGEVLIFGKTDEGIDRGVRDFVKYGNNDTYTKTYGEGYRVEKLTIAGNDISEYVIVYDSVNQSGTEEPVFAAKELSDYIAKTCGAVLPYYTDIELAALEVTPERTITLTTDYPALGNEAFRIEVGDDGNLTVFGGRNRGCIYGVYDLLEDIGWRFFDEVLVVNRGTPWEGSGTEYLYESDHVDLTSAINRVEEPLFNSRRMDANNGYKKYNNGYNFGGSVTNGAGLYNYYSYKHKIAEALYPGHGLSYVNWSGTPYEESEEYQPCLTNEENLQRVYDFYLDYAKALCSLGHVPGRDYFDISVGQLDGGNGYCKCEDCLKVVSEEGSAAGLYVRAANGLSQLLTENGLGEIPVSLLAYCQTSKPPQKTKPLPNVRVAFCYYVVGDMDNCNAHTLDGKDCSDTSFSSNKRLTERFEGWVEICAPDTIDVWYYPFHDGNAITGAPMVLNLYEDIKFLAEHRAGSVNNTVIGSSSQYCHLIEYLLNKICWQLPETYEDFLELIREWLWLNYGDCADLLFDYLLEYERLGKKVDCYTAYYINRSPLLYIGKTDMISNFTYFCGLFEEARSLVNSSVEEERLEHMEAGMLFLGVSYAYNDWYVNGTAGERELLIEKYRRLHELCTKYNLGILSSLSKGPYIFAPEELNLDENPIMWYAVPADAVKSVVTLLG